MAIKKHDREVEMRITWAQELAKNKARITCIPILENNMNNTNSSNKAILISQLHKTTQDRCFYQKPEMPTTAKNYVTMPSWMPI